MFSQFNMNKLNIFDSYLLEINNSIESKQLLLTCALQTNFYKTSLKPFDLILIKETLNSNINTDVHLYKKYYTVETLYFILLLIHIYLLAKS